MTHPLALLMGSITYSAPGLRSLLYPDEANKVRVMSSPKNLTGNITHLRDRKEGFHVGETPANHAARQSGSGERSLATDFFQFFACLLLGTAAVCQLLLILWMDLL